jgi:hypothetical protein
MYSPKIAEDLIPKIYRLAREEKLPMTKLVDNYLRPKVMESHNLLIQPFERSKENENKNQN